MDPGPYRRAGDEIARKRLGQYRRYAELMERQEAALESDDLDLFAQLADEIEELQGFIGASASDTEVLEPESSAADEARRILEGALVQGKRVQAKLAEKRRSGAQAIRSQSARRPQARRYVADVPTGAESRLDVKS